MGLMHEYQTLLTEHESMKKSLKQVIVNQDAEIFALKLLIYTQNREIDEYKEQIDGQTVDEEKEEKNEEEIDYSQWHWEDIVEWLVSLQDGKYGKYEDVLIEKLCEEDV